MTVDIATASDGCFGPDMMSLFENWVEFCAFAANIVEGRDALDMGALQQPVTAPQQVFAIGLNYRQHAEEAGMEVPEVPATFTKFASSLSGPFDDIPIVGTSVDWEVELIAVVGRQADNVSVEDAWPYIAGLTVGQDISDRKLQMAAGRQFSLGKSRRGFGPMGPWIVTPDEFDNPNDLALGCSIDGEVVQDARSSDLIFNIPTLIAELSSVLTLYPGDVIFTGTPSGVGMARTPPRALAPGNVIETWVEGIGTMRNTCV
jgi:2-keto-4-pentenoate hydratase/2-oxohepta-3-ene-1,7-dioic acid hydratase in catechol pathway